MGFCRSQQDKKGKWSLTGPYSAMDGWAVNMNDSVHSDYLVHYLDLAIWFTSSSLRTSLFHKCLIKNNSETWKSKEVPLPNYLIRYNTRRSKDQVKLKR